MTSLVRSAYLEVHIRDQQWHRVNVTVDETALVLCVDDDQMIDDSQQQQHTDKRLVRVVKHDGSGKYIINLFIYSLFRSRRQH
jgi:hypothetical protein